ncbi:MAG TPA: POTRA domain-containing protein [Terracidiphilus sp.]|nr:POTRA domain-containing protein [Terracidiphilus sp.]
MRELCVLFLGVASLLPAATPTHVQTFTPQAIHFIGAADYSDDDLANAAGLKVGESYTAGDLNRHAQQLLDTGLFEKIAYKFDGNQLTYTVKMSAQGLPIQVENLPVEGSIDDRLRLRVPLYRGTVPPSGSLLEDIRLQFGEMLAAENVRAHIAAEVVQDPVTHHAIAVRFRIDSNPVKIGTLKLEGVSDFLKPELERSNALSDVPFNTGHSAAEIEQNIQAIYAGHGFAAADVHAVRYGYPVTDVGVIRVPYKVTVKEGRSYLLGKVKLAEDLPIDPAELDNLMAERSTFMPESMFLQYLVSQLEMKLKGQGCSNCRITLVPQIDESKGVVNYTVGADLTPGFRPGAATPQAAGNGLQSFVNR